MATRVRFSKDFDFKPSSQATVAYKAGWEGPVVDACAQAAVAAKAGEIIEKDADPSKSEKTKAHG